MLLSITFYFNELNTTCNKFIQKFDIVENYVNNDSWEEATKNCNSLLNEWNTSHEPMCFVIHHEKVDNISNELTKLTQYIKFNNKEESLASIHSLIFLLQHIKQTDKISIENIL